MHMLISAAYVNLLVVWIVMFRILGVSTTDIDRDSFISILVIVQEENKNSTLWC